MSDLYEETLSEIARLYACTVHPADLAAQPKDKKWQGSTLTGKNIALIFEKTQPARCSFEVAAFVWRARHVFRSSSQIGHKDQLKIPRALGVCTTAFGTRPRPVRDETLAQYAGVPVGTG
jgi:ornithine carbamoyltransferase